MHIQVRELPPRPGESVPELTVFQLSVDIAGSLWVCRCEMATLTALAATGVFLCQPFGLLTCMLVGVTLIVFNLCLFSVRGDVSSKESCNSVDMFFSCYGVGICFLGNFLTA